MKEKLSSTISNLFSFSKEWLWKVWLQEWVLKAAALLALVLTVTLLWSEVTIASRTDPDPSKPEGPGNDGSGVDLSVWSLVIHTNGLTDIERQVSYRFFIYYL